MTISGQIWLEMYQTVSSSSSCAGNRTTLKPQLHSRPIPATGLLVFDSMESFGPLPMKIKGSQHIVIILHKFSKFTRAGPTAKTTTTVMACTSIDSWVVWWSIPSYLLKDNWTKFVSKCFDIVCPHLSSKLMTATAIHPQKSKQVGCFNKQIATHLHDNESTHERERDLLVQPSTYAYKTYVCRSTKRAPLSLVLTRHHSRTVIFDSHSALAFDACHKADQKALKTQLLVCINAL